MKRSWIGLGLLLVLLAAAVVTTWMMTDIHEPVAHALDRAAEFALAGNWKRADAFVQRATDSWEQWAHFRACLADHTPVEEIDADLAVLEIYRTTRDGPTFAAACRSLAKQIAAVGEAHELVWWNLL